ncbi:amblin-like isoform X1 [Rhipicephalus microplus]|uniref:amblin-like isoform X1 n=1 Tax=Rhipicephalus microplus TaxID=6941 RepID=UPI003F6B9225
MKSTPVLFVYFARFCHIYAHLIGASLKTPSYCLKPKASGNTCGRGPFTSWYFDSESRKCKAFTFGGCNGNLNRFSSEGQCQRWCLRGVPEKPVCSLTVEKGKGIGGIFAWSYNPTQDQCQVFLYSGFGGNSNKFRSCYQCMNRCSGNKNSRYICDILKYQFMV